MRDYGRSYDIKMELCRLSDIIWQNYHGDYLASTERALEYADVWLYGDIKQVLCEAKTSEEFDSRLSFIRETLEGSPYYGEIVPNYLDIEGVVKGAKTSMDLDGALAAAKHGGELLPALNYALSKTELLELGRLHEEGKHQKKIEELLLDIGYSTEESFLYWKMYDKFRDEVGGISVWKQDRD